MDIICAKTGLHFSSSEELRACENRCNIDCPYEKGYIGWLLSQYDKERERKIAAEYEAFLKSRQKYQLSNEENIRLEQLLNPSLDSQNSISQANKNITNNPEKTSNTKAISDLTAKNESEQNIDFLSDEAGEARPNSLGIQVPDIADSESIHQKNVLAKNKYQTYVSKRVSSPKRKVKNHNGIIAFIIILLVILGGIFIINNYSNQPESNGPVTVQISPTATIISTTPTPTPIRASEYATFENTLSGYIVDYPAAWLARRSPVGDVIFSDAEDASMTICIRYQPANYQELYNSLDSIRSEMTVEAKNAQMDSLKYSLFSQQIGEKVKKMYLFDLNTAVLIADCDFISIDKAVQNSDLINKYVTHMVLSFSLLNSSKADENIVMLSTSSSPATPIILATSSPAIKTITTGTNQTVSTPSSLAQSITPTQPIATSINSITGVYNNYFLGLMHSPEGTLTGSDCYGEFIVLINNTQSQDPDYAQLKAFLKQDKTDQFPYQYVNSVRGFYYGTAESHIDLSRIQNIIDGNEEPDPPNICADFAERLHNNAELSGIRCAYISIELSGYTDPYNYGISTDTGHALVAFQTTDEGVIYVDCTGISDEDGPKRCVTTVKVQVGKQYIPHSLFPEKGWKSTWDSMGTVTDIFLTWDGSWNN